MKTGLGGVEVNYSVSLWGLSQTYGNLWSWDGQRTEPSCPCTNQSLASGYHPAQKVTFHEVIPEKQA